MPVGPCWPSICDPDLLRFAPKLPDPLQFGSAAWAVGDACRVAASHLLLHLLVQERAGRLHPQGSFLHFGTVGLPISARLSSRHALIKLRYPHAARYLCLTKTHSVKQQTSTSFISSTFTSHTYSKISFPKAVADSTTSSPKGTQLVPPDNHFPLVSCSTRQMHRSPPRYSPTAIDDTHYPYY